MVARYEDSWHRASPRNTQGPASEASAPPELAGERYEWWDGGVIRRCVRDIQNH